MAGLTHSILHRDNTEKRLRNVGKATKISWRSFAFHSLLSYHSAVTRHFALVPADETDSPSLDIDIVVSAPGMGSA
jgi:hypothetical protein